MVASEALFFCQVVKSTLPQVFYLVWIAQWQTLSLAWQTWGLSGVNCVASIALLYEVCSIALEQVVVLWAASVSAYLAAFRSEWHSKTRSQT